MPQRDAAILTSSLRAVAAAMRSDNPASGVDLPPKVPMSNGQKSVSPITIRTAASSTRSSSATNCESARSGIKLGTKGLGE
jgi:hypothetical protein